MDFVGKNDHAPPGANLTKSHQVVAGPHVPGRVVGVTENESVNVMIDSSFEVIKVNGVASVGVAERAFFCDGVDDTNVRVETGVGWGEEEYFASWWTERAQSTNDCRVHPG
jgi:hypothetical protein